MMAATMTTEFVNDAKVMSKGQVTIPKNVRADEGRGEKGWFHV